MIVRRTLFVLALAGVLAGCANPQDTLEKYKASGKAYLEEGNFDKARVEYLNALRIEANDAEARYGLGQAFEALGSVSQAMGHYAAAVEVDAGDTLSRIAMGKVLVLARAPDRAEPFIDEVLALEPSNPDALALKAMVHSLREQHEAAEALARRVIAADPSNRIAVPMFVARLNYTDRAAEARELIESAVAREPDFVGFRAVYAQILVEAGDEAGYLSQLEKIMQLEPNIPGHVVTYATALDRAGRAGEAQALLAERAVRPDAGAQLRLSYLAYLEANDPDNAAAQYERFAEEFDDEYDIGLAYAAYLQRQGEAGRAEALYRELERVDSARHSIAASVALARMMLADQRIDEAERILARVRADNPSNQEALLLSSRLAVARGDLDAAIGDLRVAVRDDQNNPALHLDLVNAYLRNRQPLLAQEVLGDALDRMPREAQLLRAQGELAMRQGAFDEVDRVADTLLALSPSDTSAIELKYRGYIATERYADALAVAGEISSLTPDSGLGPFYEGAAQFNLLKPGLAELSYKESLRREPGTAEALSSLVKLQLSQGRVDDANATIAEQRRFRPNNPLIVKFQGDIAFSQERYDEAERHYEAAIAMEPGLAVAYKALALLHDRQGDLGAAVATLKRGLRSSSDRGLYAELALLQQANGDVGDAIATYRRALETYQADDSFANNLAMLLAEYRRTPADLEEALALTEAFENMDNPAFLDTLGWVRIQRGEYGEAVRVLQRASEMVPESGLIQYHLAKALIGQGQRETALRHLKLAVAQERRFQGLEDARNLVAELSRG